MYLEMSLVSLYMTEVVSILIANQVLMLIAPYSWKLMDKMFFLFQTLALISFIGIRLLPLDLYARNKNVWKWWAVDPGILQLIQTGEN